jgi:type I restriction-modification system DNA methylase subunit
MSDTTIPRKAQLDKAEREQLEDVVTAMRERVEDNVEFQLTQKGLDEEPEDRASLDEGTDYLIEAIDIEAVGGDSWVEAFDQYVTGVGYTIVNRLAALRCMEVRGFIDEEVTVFKDNGLTPAAETLVHEEFLLEEEAILEAYHIACDDLAEEIEILFDRSSAYSLIDPDDDTFEDLAELLDKVPDEVWRADDVLGWVYEYYNVKLLDDIRWKADHGGLDPDDVPPANQFYTPHWVVRMLTDNSLGKLYLEHSGELQNVITEQSSLSSTERKNRPLSPDESSTVAEFCTYLVPSEEGGEPTDFTHPSELRIMDPACGSGHFLLYAFDVLERIWRVETDVDYADIPQKILEKNLHGVDVDMRACQLSAFNLYLKARTRAEAEGAESFDMPEVGIVCADSKVAEMGGIEDVLAEVSNQPRVQETLKNILESFEEVHGLGSILDVRGALKDLFDDGKSGQQLSLSDDFTIDRSLQDIISTIQDRISEQRDSESLKAKDLRSFVRFLNMMVQDYDITLMNPPYGSGGRMPNEVQSYIEEHYSYKANYYITFFQVCDNLSKTNGRIGMLVPRSFMYKGRYSSFRTDFISSNRWFDFLAEFGLGILDNAAVTTVGTIVRTGTSGNPMGDFYRLHDVDAKFKERTFLNILSGEEGDIQRTFKLNLSDIEKIPRSPISYSVPSEVLELYDASTWIDASHANIEGKSAGRAVSGLVTAGDNRFVRTFWEIDDFDRFKPLGYGGSEAWITPAIKQTAEWIKSGRTLKRSSSSVRTPNDEYYGKKGLMWTRIKGTGRRFGYYPGGLFNTNSFMLFPYEDRPIWKMLAALNTDLYNVFFLSQTPEKEWDADVIGSVPWIEELEEAEELEEIAKTQYQTVIEQRLHNPCNPYYVGPSLFPVQEQMGYFFNHPHNETERTQVDFPSRFASPKKPLRQTGHEKKQEYLSQRKKLESLSESANKIVYDTIGLSNETRSKVLAENFLRTKESREDRNFSSLDSVPKERGNIEYQVKDLVHHFAIEAVRDESDGIIPLHCTDDQYDMLDRIVESFEDAYEEYAEDRLVEVDEILGAKSATNEAYPNLRSFIAEDLFDYHVNRMENTPILWRLTTERLIADAKGEGFACFVDYHSLDSSLFDRLSNQYLESRKAELREQRSAANRRRGDEALSASEQAEAAEQYERCASGLDQIAVFEDVIQDLGSVDEREFDESDRALVKDLAPKVAAFREETRERLDTLAELHERKDSEWFKDTFSEKFWETVDEWRDEWLDALAELESACEAYAKPTDEPVEAHLADLFDYFSWRLKGSDHYSSSGILFMTYYFEREGSDLLDENGQPHDHLSEDERRLASLAMGLDDVSIVDEEYLEAVADDESVGDIEDLPPLAEFKALAEEIDDRCQNIASRIPSDWADRALSEIATAGYQPNHKHGVKINIIPLAEAKIVPKLVNDKVL